MEIAGETDKESPTKSVLDNQVTSQSKAQQNDNEATLERSDYGGPKTAQFHEKECQHQQPQPKAKRKHRRGKPKSKNANKPYKNTNWKFQIPRFNYNYKSGNGAGGCGNISGNSNGTCSKLARSRSLVPYNTNKFLMEEHLAEVPSSLLTPSGRTRDSSFSVDSDENYFYSLPEDEEEFLTKEFDNIYEKSRVEHLENLTKQQLIEECLQMEDRYSTDRGTQQQQIVQRISSEFMANIRVLEEKIRELTRENFDLRSQLMRSAALAAAAAASPPSATAPTASACQPMPMDSLSEDSESDSSNSSSSLSSASFHDGQNGIEDDDDYCEEMLNYQPARGVTRRSGVQDVGLQHYDERLNELRSASTSRSSVSEYEMAGIDAEIPKEDHQLVRVEMEADDKLVNSNDVIVSRSNYIDELDLMTGANTRSLNSLPPGRLNSNEGSTNNMDGTSKN